MECLVQEKIRENLAMLLKAHPSVINIKVGAPCAHHAPCGNVATMLQPDICSMCTCT